MAFALCLASEPAVTIFDDGVQIWSPRDWDWDWDWKHFWQDTFRALPRVPDTFRAFFFERIAPSPSPSPAALLQVGDSFVLPSPSPQPKDKVTFRFQRKSLKSFMRPVLVSKVEASFADTGLSVSCTQLPGSRVQCYGESVCALWRELMKPGDSKDLIVLGLVGVSCLPATNSPLHISEIYAENRPFSISEIYAEQ